MHFHLGWSGPIDGFGHGGYYAGDGHYGHVSYQQDRRATWQENRTVLNAKLNHLVSLKMASDLGHWNEQKALKYGSSTDESGSNQGQTRPRSETSANDEAKPDMEKSLEEVAPEQNRVLEVKAKIRKEAETSSRQLPNRTVQFPKSDHPILSGSGQKGTLVTMISGTAPPPRWCPPGLMPCQRRRI
jgi:hypothetical protein